MTKASIVAKNKLSYWYTASWNARSDDHHKVSTCTDCGKGFVQEADNPPQRCELCVIRYLDSVRLANA